MDIVRCDHGVYNCRFAIVILISSLDRVGSNGIVPLGCSNTYHYFKFQE
jgi:hypothetical protein